jgi:hypothetical protein
MPTIRLHTDRIELIESDKLLAAGKAGHWAHFFEPYSCISSLA